MTTPTYDRLDLALRRRLHDLIAEGRMPRFVRWFRPLRPGARGDCEVTATALYADLVGADLDSGWSLVEAKFPAIGSHVWCAFDDGEREWAVNANCGTFRVIAMDEYLAANDLLDLREVRIARRGDAFRLHAIATKISAGTAGPRDVDSFARAFRSSK